MDDGDAAADGELATESGAESAPFLTQFGAGGAGPLEGVRVLDLTSVVMGPLSTQILGDLGADVITVEAARGETNRVMGPGPHPELSGISLNLLRNKRNVRIDMKDPAGRDAVLRVASTCDVVVTNLRPGPLGRLGLAYDDIVKVRPDVVYCQAHGYPSTSERAEAPAYDDIVQAASGVADAVARVTGTPGLAPTIFADKVCGLTIVYAVLAALFHRERTGEGQHIEVPMVETTTAFMLVEHGSGAIAQPRTHPAGYPRILTPHRRPQRTADGWVNILPYSQEHWEEIFRQGGRHDLVGDERVASGRGRIQHSDFLYQALAGIVVDHSTEWWLDLCRQKGIPATAVATLEELVDELPEADHPVAGRYKVIPPPVRFSKTPPSVRRPAPLVGEHGREVLLEAGLDAAEIDALVDGGVLKVRSAP